MVPSHKSDVKEHRSRGIRNEIFPVQPASQSDEADSERDESNGEIVNPIGSDSHLDRKLPSSHADFTSISIEASYTVAAPRRWPA